jgi:hypothetical protein
LAGQALDAKIIRFAFSENYDLLSSSRLDQEGRFAIVTNVGVGCDGLSELQLACERTNDSDRTAKSYCPGAPTLALSRLGDDPSGDGG